MKHKPASGKGNTRTATKTWNQRVTAIRLVVWQWRYAVVALSAGLASMGVLQILAPPQPAQATVLFAARALPVGTTLQPQDLAEVTLPARYASGLVSDPEQVVGRVTITGVAADSPIWQSGLSSADLGGVAPSGLVVVPIRLDAVTTSILVPGDVVDLVQVSSDGTNVVARNALVLPARLETPAASSGIFSTGSTATPVTLIAVAPAEAPQVAASAHLNQISAILIP